MRPMSRWSLFTLLPIAAAAAAPVHAAAPDEVPAPAPETPDTEEPPADAPAPEPPVDLPRVDLPAPKTPAPPPEHRGFDVPAEPVVRFVHHGFFRVRPELLVGGDLGPGYSPVPEPLGLATGVDPDAGALAWASMRLRYEPTVMVASSFEIHLGLDAFSNTILGSSPAAAGRPDLVTDLLGDAQVPPSDGDIGFRDVLTVREAWARWLAFDALDLRVGRMVDHFGLGLVRNDGACDDCDGGTIVDRVLVGVTVSGFRIQAGWEFTATGATTDLAFPSERAAGQPKDFGQEDDVSTYTIEAGRFATTVAEQRERARILDEAREWSIEWSLFSSFTDQPRSTSEQLDEASVECAAAGELRDGQPIQAYDCIRAFRRGAFFWRPGLWFLAEQHPAHDERVRIEVEAAGLFGEVAHPQRFVDDDEEVAKVFQGLGLAFELEWQRAALGLGVDGGFATGDNGEHIGVLDGQDVVDPDDDAYATNDALRDNGTVTSFIFNRDYRLDLILFRQVIGAVTNAVYLKPWVSYDLFRSDDLRLSLRFDLLWAAAMRPSGTPGDGQQWGLELDGHVGLETTGGFTATLGVGLLVPFDALRDPVTGDDPEPAGALRGVLGWRF